MSSLSALMVDLVFHNRTKGSAHPKGEAYGHGNKENEARELQHQSLLDRDVRYSPATRRVQTVLNTELSVSLSSHLNASFHTSGVNGVSESISLSTTFSSTASFYLKRAYGVIEDSAQSSKSVERSYQQAQSFDMQQRLDALGLNEARLDTGVDDLDGESDEGLDVDVGAGFDLGAIVENVMAFIGARIRAAQESGESPDHVNELAEKAKAGVEQGIGEASIVLERLQAISEDIEERLEALNETLQQRIDQQAQYIVPSLTVEESAEENSDVGSVDPGEVDETAETIHGESHREGRERGVLNSRYSSQLSQRREEQLHLDIMTQEGDRITLSISQGFDLQESNRIRLSGGSGISIRHDSRLSQFSNLTYQVEGHINADEQRALDALFTKVNEMADQFYSGDVAKAFESALALRIDPSELSAMSLNMSSRHVTEMRETYRQVEKPLERPEGQYKVADGLASLMDYLGEVSNKVALLNEGYALPNLGGYLNQLLPEAVAIHPQKESDLITAEEVDRLVNK